MTKGVIFEDFAKGISERLRWLFLGWGFVGAVYVLSHYLQRQGHIVPATFVDDWLIYNVHAVWAYLSFFVFIPLAYLKCHPSQVRCLARGMQLCAAVAGFIYLIYPTTMVFTEWNFNGSSGWVMAHLVAIDSPQNCAPSLHIALSVLATIALCHRAPIGQRVFFVLWLLCIVFSVMVLKRHMFIDVITGVVLAVSVVAIKNQWRVWKKSAKSREEGWLSGTTNKRNRVEKR